MVCIFGPATRPASIAFFNPRSVYGSTLPVVRMVVTPPARYSLGKLDACSGAINSSAAGFTFGAG